MEVNTEPMTPQHTSQLLTGLQSEGQGTAMFGATSSLFARHLSKKKNSNGTER